MALFSEMQTLDSRLTYVKYQNQLGTETWFYAKRPFCALLETLSRHMLLLRDASFQEIIAFLNGCEAHGVDIPAHIDPANTQQPTEEGIVPCTIGRSG